jgi:hypothetical protein
MDKNKSFFLKCECGDHVLSLNTEFEDSYMTFFYRISGSYLTWKERLKVIWNILRKRDYILYDLVIYEDQWKDFQKFVADN